MSFRASKSQESNNNDFSEGKPQVQVEAEGENHGPAAQPEGGKNSKVVKYLHKISQEESPEKEQE